MSGESIQPVRYMCHTWPVTAMVGQESVDATSGSAVTVTTSEVHARAMLCEAAQRKGLTDEIGERGHAVANHSDARRVLRPVRHVEAAGQSVLCTW